MMRPLATVTARLHESGQSSGHAVSTRLDVLPFTVWHGQLTQIAADFPATSFY